MEPSELFKKALKSILKERPRGSQGKLADDAGVGRKHLSDYLGGRAPLSEAKRSLIAEALGYTYEDFLALGRQLLEGKPIAEEKEPFPHYNEIMRLPIVERAWAIMRQAAEAHGAVGFLSAFGDPRIGDKPKFMKKFLAGEQTEVELYEESLKVFEDIVKSVRKAIKEQEQGMK